MQKPLRRVGANASRLLAVHKAAVRGCKAGVRCVACSRLSSRSAAILRCQSAICGWYGCNLVAFSAPQRWHTDLLVCYRPLATPQPEAVQESKSKCCGGRTDPATRAATAAAARFGRLESCSAALLGPPYVLFSRPQALASPPFTCTHCSRNRWPGLAAEASITITLCCSWAHHHRGRPD